ncbi:MAG TPA: hypothetical protein VEJ63_21365 [Planctomycetota bacterium]|nr:hypothetical protein [Planctomycetota bacterium]
MPLQAGEWRAPDTPKDDKHWYPELPDNKEPHETVVNGGFEEAGETKKGFLPHPKGWAHPDDLTSFWATDKEKGRVIVLDTDVLESEARKRQAAVREAGEKGTDVPAAPKKSAVTEAQQYEAIGGTYGVSFYSEKIKCKPKQAYKISFDFKGPGGGAKVWVRGWGPFQGEDRRRFETIVNCRTAGDGWRHFEQAFHPSRFPLGKDSEGKPKVVYREISYLRIMLYAYWPRGQYAFDNFKLEEISDEEYEKLRNEPATAK